MADAPKQPETKKPASLTERLALAIKEGKPVSGTFRLTEKHYRAGTLHMPGELITVENEVPGKSWEPFDPDAPVRPAVPKAAPKANLPSNTEI